MSSTGASAAAYSEQSMEEAVSRELSGKKVLRRFDSLDIESSTVPGRHGHASKVYIYINIYLCFLLL
jgi:hypothetical protein